MLGVLLDEKPGASQRNRVLVLCDARAQTTQNGLLMQTPQKIDILGLLSASPGSIPVCLAYILFLIHRAST